MSSSGPEPSVAPWLSPSQAAIFLGCSGQDVIKLVEANQIRAHRLPTGALVFAANELAALRSPVSAAEAVALLTNHFSQENDMNHAVASSSTAALTLVPRPPSHAQDVFIQISDLIEETRAKLERLPMWLGVKDVKRIFGIDNRRLQELVLNGFVRKAKLGETLQSKTLYAAVDLDDVLSRLAAGKPPRSALRKGVNDAA